MLKFMRESFTEFYDLLSLPFKSKKKNNNYEIKAFYPLQ